MFAIFLHESMDPFYQVIGSFPTAIFTFLLVLCALYWLLAVLGMVDIDFLDLDMDLTPESETGTSFAEMVSGILIRYGLVGVPLTVVISFLSLFGWLISYFTVYLGFSALSISPHEGLMHYIVGLPVFVATLYVALRLTALAIRPVRSLFKKALANEPKAILGRVGVVRTGYVDEAFGEGVFEDGGAGLILKLRADPGVRFNRNDRVVLIKYLEDQHAYLVISEAEFHGAVGTSITPNKS